MSVHKKRRHRPGQREDFLKEHLEAIIERNDEYIILRGWHSRNPDARDPHAPRQREVCRMGDGKLLLRFSINDYEDQWPTWMNNLYQWYEHWEEAAQDNG